MGLLKIEALTYIRGRSIPEGFMIIDEAQNLTPHEIKTIVTRAGENTKIVFTGDPYQIDNPYLDAESNGLTYLAERFRDVKKGNIAEVTPQEKKVKKVKKPQPKDKTTIEKPPTIDKEKNIKNIYQLKIILRELIIWPGKKNIGI